MKVLITGARGQVGQALLQSAPADVVVLGLSHQELDIGEPDAVLSRAREFHPDLIINSAAYTAVDRAEKEPDAAHRINADGARNLASAAHDVGARLLHISTDFVFDGQSSTPYSSESPTRPLNVYGLSKRAGELEVLQRLENRAVVLRTAWVYSATGSNFLLTMLRLMKANSTLRVVADQIGTPTSSHSLADTLWKIAARPDLGGVHQWTDAGVATWYDFAVAIAEEAARLGLVSPDVSVIPIATSDYPTPARRPGFSVLDKGSLTQLGFVNVHWRKNLRSVLKEVRRA